MRMRSVVTGVAVALVAAACNRAPSTSGSAELSESLRKDLDQATAPVTELAASQNRSQQVVSALELGVSPKEIGQSTALAKRTRHAPSAHKARVATPKPAPTVEEVAMKHEATEPAPTPTVEPVQTASASSPDPEPTAGPRPTPMPVPAGEPAPEGGGGLGGVIGTVIGVVIRGGSVGDDHCDPRGGGVVINRQIPPIGPGTFPGRVRFPHH